MWWEKDEGTHYLAAVESGRRWESRWASLPLRPRSRNQSPSLDRWYLHWGKTPESSGGTREPRLMSWGEMEKPKASVHSYLPPLTENNDSHRTSWNREPNRKMEKLEQKENRFSVGGAGGGRAHEIMIASARGWARWQPRTMETHAGRMKFWWIPSWPHHESPYSRKRLITEQMSEWNKKTKIACIIYSSVFGHFSKRGCLISAFTDENGHCLWHKSCFFFEA